MDTSHNNAMVATMNQPLYSLLLICYFTGREHDRVYRQDNHDKAIYHSDVLHNSYTHNPQVGRRCTSPITNSRRQLPALGTSPGAVFHSLFTATYDRNLRAAKWTWRTRGQLNKVRKHVRTLMTFRRRHWTGL